MRLVPVLLATTLRAAEPDVPVAWPSNTAPHTIEIAKIGGLEDAGGLTDSQWVHLHKGHHSAADAATATIAVRLRRNGNQYDLIPLTEAASGLQQVRFTLRGVVASPWMPISAVTSYVLSLEALSADLPDGIHHLSLEVSGPAAFDYRPLPIYVHLTRGLLVSRDVPLMHNAGLVGSRVEYVDARTRSFRGYPLNPDPARWDLAPPDADLFLERLAANGNWGRGVQMWWEELPHNLPFARELPAKLANDDHRSARVDGKQERLPFKDGPRGVGWVGNLITGQIDAKGRFAFAELGGRVGWVMPDGEVVTVAGWRVAPDKDPVWITKSMAQIRGNMELRGTWADGARPGEVGGFRTPVDVAIDPRNDYVWYVAATEDHCIWKVVIDPVTSEGTVSVFAGALDHEPGLADGRGTNARFNGPASIVFDPLADAMYVADQMNHSIRRIGRDGVVSTLAGRSDMIEYLATRVADPFSQTQVRQVSRLTVSRKDTRRKVRPDVYAPQTVRVDSRGRLIVLDSGFGSIRRIDPRTMETTLLGWVDNKFQRWVWGWAWLDVDRWGNSGPKDGIYWCKSVGETADGETSSRFNEVYAWMPPEGGASRYIFGPVWEGHPNGWGSTRATNPPHYPWLVAVDPRGGVLISGMGEHGVSRLRGRRPSDVAPGPYTSEYYRGRDLWNLGGLSQPSLAVKFGWDGHNLLGFPDAWGLRGDETDLELFDLFGAPPDVRNDATKSALWLSYVRYNARH